MLVLRHKKKTKSIPVEETHAANGELKEPQHGESQMYHQGNEMATNANVWELEAHGVPVPRELEAGNVYGVKHKTKDQKGFINPALR
jgi:hypothetical protein